MKAGRRTKAVSRVKVLQFIALSLLISACFDALGLGIIAL
jgi:hypothetical protein